MAMFVTAVHWGAIKSEEILCIDSGTVWSECKGNFVRRWIKEIRIFVRISRWISNFTENLCGWWKIIYVNGICCCAGGNFKCCGKNICEKCKKVLKVCAKNVKNKRGKILGVEKLKNLKILFKNFLLKKFSSEFFFKKFFLQISFEKVFPGKFILKSFSCKIFLKKFFLENFSKKNFLEVFPWKIFPKKFFMENFPKILLKKKNFRKIFNFPQIFHNLKINQTQNISNRLQLSFIVH